MLYSPLEQRAHFECQVQKGLVKVPLQDVLVLTRFEGQQSAEVRVLLATATQEKHSARRQSVRVHHLSAPGLSHCLPALKIPRRRLDSKEKNSLVGPSLVINFAFITLIDQEGREPANHPLYKVSE